jgi:AefR-like transcriptional repressor, C-terminal domain
VFRTWKVGLLFFQNESGDIAGRIGEQSQLRTARHFGRRQNRFTAKLLRLVQTRLQIVDPNIYRNAVDAFLVGGHAPINGSGSAAGIDQTVVQRVVAVDLPPKQLAVEPFQLLFLSADDLEMNDWYELGFERVLATLASCFQRLAQHQLLRLDDPLLAANHFVGLLLWIPLNQAMFSGEHHASKADLERYARAAAHAFLGGYGRSFLPASSRTARGRRPADKKSG